MKVVYISLICLIKLSGACAQTLPVYFTGGTGFANTDLCGGAVLNMTAPPTGPGEYLDWFKLEYNPGTCFQSGSPALLASNVNSIIAFESGTYFYRLMNASGQMIDQSYNVYIFNPSIPGYICAPGPTTFCTGTTTWLRIIPQSWTAASGYNYTQWQLNGVDIPGVTSSNYLPVQSGNYRVRFTNSCGDTTYSNDIPVNIVSNLTPSISGVTAICQGQSTTLNAGSGYVSYLWSTGAVSQTITTGTPGIYTVTVTNAGGCTGSASVNVTVNPNPTPVISGNNVICQGQNTVLSASGVYSNYLWNQGQTTQSIQVNSSNVYTVTVTDANGCTGSTTVNVTVNPLPGIGITAVGSTSFCQGDSVRLEAMGVGASYLWHRNNSMVTPINATMVHYAKTKGSYYCVITDFNGCSNSSNIINVDVPCVPIDPAQQRDPVSDDDDQAGLVVFPNPSFDEFTVRAGSPLAVQPGFTVTDLTGRAIDYHWRKADQNTWKISIPHPGFYLIKYHNQTVRMLKLE